MKESDFQLNPFGMRKFLLSFDRAKRKRKMNKKGQLSLINIVMWVVLVGVGAVVTPIISEFMDGVYQSTNNSMAQVVATGVVPVFWLGIIITFLLYVTPINPRQY